MWTEWWVRWKDWQTDLRPAWKGLFGPQEHLFLKENDGACDVRSQAAFEFFIRHPSGRYVIAYDRYVLATPPSAEGLAVMALPEEQVKAPPTLRRNARKFALHPRR